MSDEDILAAFAAQGIVYHGTEHGNARGRLLEAAHLIVLNSCNAKRRGSHPWTWVSNHEWDLLCFFKGFHWQDQNADVNDYGKKLLKAALVIDAHARSEPSAPAAEA